VLEKPGVTIEVSNPSEKIVIAIITNKTTRNAVAHLLTAVLLYLERLTKRPEILNFGTNKAVFLHFDRGS